REREVISLVRRDLEVERHERLEDLPLELLRGRVLQQERQGPALTIWSQLQRGGHHVAISRCRRRWCRCVGSRHSGRGRWLTTSDCQRRCKRRQDVARQRPAHRGWRIGSSRERLGGLLLRELLAAVGLEDTPYGVLAQRLARLGLVGLWEIDVDLLHGHE